MSMMPLLSASRSLVGSRDLGKQYRMTDPKSLPKFGEKGAEKHQAGKLQTPNSKLQRSSKFQTPNNSHAEAPGIPERQGLIAIWFGRLKKIFGKRERAGTSTIPRFAAGPVQCELSLDNVKVLRNDLSDTDFEVIAKPIEPEKPRMPEAKPQPAQSNREKIWDRVTTLLGVGQT